MNKSYSIGCWSASLLYSLPLCLLHSRMSQHGSKLVLSGVPSLTTMLIRFCHRSLYEEFLRSHANTRRHRIIILVLHSPNHFQAPSFKNSSSPFLCHFTGSWRSSSIAITSGIESSMFFQPFWDQVIYHYSQTSLKISEMLIWLQCKLERKSLHRKLHLQTLKSSMKWSWIVIKVNAFLTAVSLTFSIKELTWIVTSN